MPPSNRPILDVSDGHFDKREACHVIDTINISVLFFVYLTVWREYVKRRQTRTTRERRLITYWANAPIDRDGRTMSSAEILPDTLGLQRYDKWNTAIAEEFFSGTSSGSPVYLDLEHKVAERICETIGCDLEDVAGQLAQAVRGTLDFTGTGNPFRVHLSRLRAWRESESVEAPPVVSLLAFFSLVAEVMVADREFAANNYYGRLARMLGVDADQSKRLVDGYRRAAQICWDELNPREYARDPQRGRMHAVLVLSLADARSPTGLVQIRSLPVARRNRASRGAP